MREKRWHRDGPICIRAEPDCRFDDEKATPKQEKELRDILSRYIRRKAIRCTDGLPAEAYVDALGVKARRAAEIVRESEEDEYGCEVRLLVDMLTAMATRKIAGLLGTPHNGTSEWVFARVRSIDLRELAARCPGLVGMTSISS